MQDVQPFGLPSGWQAGRRRAATLLALGLLLPGIDSRAETFDVATGSTEDVSSDLGGGATVIKQGAGTLRMTTDQTFTGDVTVDDGTLIFYGAATPAAITVNGGTLMLGGETAGGITLNGGRLAIGSQRSISWTSIDPGGNKIRDFIPSDGKNADWNFGSAGTFYAQNWAAGLLQPQAVIDAGLPDSGLVTSLADPSIAYQFKLGGLDGGRINSNSGGDTAFIVIPDEQRANFVEMQTLLGTNQLGSGRHPALHLGRGHAGRLGRPRQQGHECLQHRADLSLPGRRLRRPDPPARSAGDRPGRPEWQLRRLLRPLGNGGQRGERVGVADGRRRRHA